VWEPQRMALEQAGATVTIAEHGLLDSLGAMAESILAYAPSRFALAGHSMGGRVALEVQRRAPGRVSHLALLDTGCLPLPAGAAGERERRARHELLEIGRRQGMRPMAERWVQTMVHPDRLHDRVLVDRIVDMLARRTPLHQAQQVKALLARPDASEVLRGVRCPALVLCGREDQTADVAHHEYMAGLVRDAQLVVLERCGHMCTLEQPAAVAAQLCDWVRR